MIEFLKSKGYKFTTNQTLNNREFRHLSTSLTPNEEATTFAKVAYTETSEYELFLDEKFFNSKKVVETLVDSRSYEVFDDYVENSLRYIMDDYLGIMRVDNLTVSANIVTVETGRLITFIVEET